MQNNNLISMNPDAWSDGQVRSKLWACQRIEEQMAHQPRLNIWILGSWYGLLGQFLLIRQKLDLAGLHFFDLDSEALAVAEKLLEHWRVAKTHIQFHHLDCEKMDTQSYIETLGPPQLIVNTSCEHFLTENCLRRLPKGTKVLLQSTNMPHPTHKYRQDSLSSFAASVSDLIKIKKSEKIKFIYPNWQFERYMIFGEHK